MTRLFNRKDKTTIAELEEFYATSGNKHRSNMAWVWAFLSIALTIALVIGLLFFVRWVYRAVTDDNDSSTTTTSETGGVEDELPTFDSDVSQEGQDTTSGSTSEGGGTVSDEAATTDNGNATATGSDSSSSTDSVSSTGSTDSSTLSTTGGTGGENSNIPDTGAGEVIVFVPLAVGFAGYYISRKRQISQNR